MESLPQELIDKIIDNLPHSSLDSSSLVARRWRYRSHRRLFSSVEFSSERDLVLWCTNIPQDPDGIPSYVRFARFQEIRSWHEPALFGRVLKNFTRMTMLWINKARIPPPDELPAIVSFGEFGKKVELLILFSPRCTVATITSLVLSFPNLEDFLLSGTVSKNPLATLPCTLQRRPLGSLRLCAAESGVGVALAQSGLRSRRFSLSVCDSGLKQLLALSSEVIVELILSVRRPFPIHQASESPSVDPLPPLPSLTNMGIRLLPGEPYARLAYVLSSIRSAPALASVTFTAEEWRSGEYFSFAGPWVDMDKWLARMALQTEVRGGLTVTLVQWPEDEPIWKEYLPEFRKVGGKLKFGND